MISGMVVRDGAPMEGAYVRLIGPAGEFVSERRTGADGCFAFHVDGDGWKLIAYGPKAARVEQDVPAAGDETLIVDISKRGDG
ncbi:MAG: DUF1416 domain-containing protein [Actinomycetota bacterium]